ncbi:uncharacterized protein B0T23DRAFT_444266 [Neurospora hispaniola]|uniref:Uncharacterized protein n=1 Tax=Neurospora hispaniola TaxID=588809 RepID=A0AAJ0MQU2_9PEZI|nr:hypothetical protein B0T23DRAFT_444266 [Neurospora hispaniola]
MPVVIEPDSDPQSGKNHDWATSSPSNLLYHTSANHSHYPTLHSSFSSQHDPSGSTNSPFSNCGQQEWLRPYRHPRPFSFFTNRNAEALRHLFVSHHGQQEVVVDVDAPSVGAVTWQSG